MAPPLPRILSAVPQASHVRLEIAKAIHTVFAREHNDPQPQLSRVRENEASDLDVELIEECARELRQEFLSLLRAHLERRRRNSAVKAAVDDPKHPGWPAHTPDGKGGQFRPKYETVATADELPPGIGHNQGPPLEDPPKIPLTKPATRIARRTFIMAAAVWLAAAESWAAFKFRAALQAVTWLQDRLPAINTYSNPPKSLEELQQDAQNPQPGYNIHHIVEQEPARKDGFPDSMIDGPENLVRVPTLRHRQISAWYQMKNPDFKDPNNPEDPEGMPPRDYLRGKSWEERRRIGIDALIKFGVLKP